MPCMRVYTAGYYVTQSTHNVLSASKQRHHQHWQLKQCLLGTNVPENLFLHALATGKIDF